MGSKMKKLHLDNGCPKDEEPPMSSKIEETMGKVFGNHLLLGKILEHVIYPSNDNQVDYKDIPNIRLVQKSWLETTSKILRKNQHPLFNIQTSIINSLNEYLEPGEDKLLDRVVSTITRPERIESFIPPISLRLVCGFFVPENQEDLSKFLVSCGSALTSLEITIPKSCSMSFIFPQFSLPNLQQLSIDFVVHTHEPNEDDNDNPDENNDEMDVFQNNITVPYFFQQIFNSTNKLKTLKFTASVTAESDIIPFGFHTLRLPTSVTTLLMKCPVLSKHLEMIVRGNEATSTNLTRLEIMASKVPFPEGTINRILVRHRATLKILKLSGRKFQFVPFPEDVNLNLPLPSLFNIPAMKNLEKLSLSSPRWTGVSNLNMNSINFPNLTTFKMKRVTLALFEQITNKYRVKLNLVKRLKISLVNDEDDEQRFETALSINGERMQRVHVVFGQVTNLDITVCGKEICGLKYIFNEMVQLTSLTISVQNWLTNLTCAAWDGLFIGAPEEIARELRNSPEFWPYFTLTPNNSYPSIQRLTVLSKLTLDSTMPAEFGLISGIRRSLISEVSFYFAFMKMPQLRNLHLSGRFRPNEAMADLWQKGEKSAECLVYGKERKSNDGWMDDDVETGNELL